MVYSLEVYLWQIVFWEKSSIYYRQDFITLHDGMIRFTSFTKMAIIGATTEQVLANIKPQQVIPASIPQPTSDLQAFLDFNQCNKEKLAQEGNTAGKKMLSVTTAKSVNA